MNLKKTYFLLILVILWGCSTKKNTSLSRGYHNLTAHYNVYFNGIESFKEGVKAIEDGNTDDYTQVLSVFPDSKPGSESVASSQMDRAIEKGTKLIKVHSIRKKPEKKRDDQSVKYKKFLSQNEFNKWVDNAYLLIGKSHFYKHDFYLAQQSFAFMFREFQSGPEWYEAEIWNARAAIELSDFGQAKILLENYDLEGKAPSSLFAVYAATYADFYIRQGMYNDAILFLQEAIKGSWSKYYSRRFNFILAQLYQKQEQYASASKAYLAVIKSNPPYEMAFNAKVNRAGVLFEEGGLEAVKKEIKRLLRDKRNLDYEDQIYYALAMAYKVEEQEGLAMENFALSIEKSIDNNHQKGMSFYELSEVYYARPEYKPAFYNLDSAVVNLNENFPGLFEINERHESLRDLVDNINIVEREDSLISVMSLSEPERLALIDGLIKEEKDRLAAIKKAEEEGAIGDAFFDPMMSQSGSRGGQQAQGGKWYFYNQTSIGMGKMEFERKWGRRKLEDNWRRSNKRIVAEEPMELLDPDDVFGKMNDLPTDSVVGNKVLKDIATKQKASKPLSRASYLKDLPSTPELRLEADKRIQNGLLNQGLIYKDEIDNIPFAVEAFRQLVIRYPKGGFLEDGLMNLYLCYELQDNKLEMAKIKNRLMNEFPDGEFTAYLNDPAYFEKRAARDQKMETLYQQTYSNYLLNDFSSPIANLEQAKQIDPENDLIAKFKFLAGLSYAKTGVYPQFEKELTDIKQNYPNNEVTPVAIEILQLYADGRTPVKGPVTTNLIAKRTEEFSKEQSELGNAKVNEDIASSFTTDHKAQHALILMVNPETDMNRLKFNIADYNFSKFLLNDYEMGSAKLPDGTSVFTVSGFNNRLEALDYFYSMRERDDIFKVDNLKEKHLYVIHAKNLEYLTSSGDKDGYDSFFVKNYLSADAFKNLEMERKQEAEDARKLEEKKKIDELRKLQDEQQEKKVIEPEIEAKLPTKEKETAIKQDAEKEEVKKQVEQKVKEKITENLQTAVAEQPNKETSIIEKPSMEFVLEEGMYTGVILFKKGRINTKQLGTVFKNYTKSNYGTKYQVEHNKKGTDYYYILIKGFSSANEAKKYLDKVKFNSFLMRDISRTTYYLWAITNNNFLRLSNEESFQLYQQFYKTNY